MPLKIIRQDITKMKVDAIVNTTNERMVGYSGVDMAVHEVAGPELDAECKKLVPLGLGSAKITKGYKLPARYIIHTSGPIWYGGLFGESIILKSCYTESLNLALKYNCNSIAFPLISSGVYAYPKDQVLKFAISVITEFLFEHEMDVYLCVFDKTSYQFSKKLFDELTEFIDDDYVENHDEDRILAHKTFDEPHFKENKKNSYSNLNSQCYTPSVAGDSVDKSFHEYMKSMDKSFAHKLFDFIDEKGLTDVECYKRANVDKKTFSKIRCNPEKYRPSKQTAVAFAIALKLNLNETQDLLASAGLTLSRSFIFDKIILYFIQKEIYDIFEINEALFEFDQVLLGC